MRQGRTDAWIAHQLEVSASELREFRRRHELNAEDEPDETDLRDEIEAEIEAATREEELAGEADDDEDDDEDSDGDDEDGEGEGEGDRARSPRPRRRRRRGGRGKRAGANMQASFDHGKEGYGLWLDPAIADDPVYGEHWADIRQVEVSVEPDRIVIKRTGTGAGTGAGGGRGRGAAASDDDGRDDDAEDSED